ncbi:MAG: FAD-dependent oxidoreductase [Anaerolineae bacterium]|nr:FAD-dependent oxidoreductase [Anaerolineae bacterium]
METYKYVIIGGGLAGQRACDGIRKVDTGGSIALVAAEPHAPYQRPPLSKGYLRGEEGLDKVYLREEAYYAENGIQVVSGVRANGIDPAARSVTLDDGRTMGYEKLLLATGGRAWRLPISGNDLPGVFTLRTIEDADAIHKVAKKGKRALVVGGSFIGSEAAASLTQLGLGVTMVFLESRLLEPIVPEDLSAWLHAKYQANGVRILSGATLKCLKGRESVERAVICDHESHVLEIDLVVMGVGIRLDTELARSAGLEMAENGGVVVNAHLRTSDPDIYAAGDVAAWPDPTFGKRLRVEHWDVARRQGLRVGGNMAGEEKPYTALPYFFSDLFDLSFEVWGDLTSWDQTVLRGSLESGSFACYYFAGNKLAGVLAAGRPDEERKPMQALVRARPTYEEVAARLPDETFDLNTLIE